MDANWWMWNIALACFPALGLGAICRYYRSDMEQFYIKQQAVDKNRMQGDDSSDGDDGDGDGNGDGNGNDNGVIVQNGTVWATQKTTVWNAAMNVFGFESNSQIKQPGNDQGEQETHDTSTHKVESLSLSVEEDTNDGNAVQSSQAQEQPTIEQLIHRVETLEKQLGTKEAKNSRDHGEQRPHQSNIQNRRDAQARQRIEDADPKDYESKTIRLDRDGFKEGLKKRMQERSDEIFQRCTELKRTILEQVSSSSTNEEIGTSGDEKDDGPLEDNGILVTNININPDGVQKHEDLLEEVRDKCKDVTNAPREHWWKKLVFRKIKHDNGNDKE